MRDVPVESFSMADDTISQLDSGWSEASGVLWLLSSEKTWAASDALRLNHVLFLAQYLYIHNLINKSGK